MRQYISPAQLQELTDEQKIRFRNWWLLQTGDTAFPSIGQLIELLNSLKYKMQITKKLNPSSNRIELWWHDGGKRKFRYYGGSDLIDALWQAVKEVL